MYYSRIKKIKKRNSRCIYLSKALRKLSTIISETYFFSHKFGIIFQLYALHFQLRLGKHWKYLLGKNTNLDPFLEIVYLHLSVSFSVSQVNEPALCNVGDPLRRTLREYSTISVLDSSYEDMIIKSSFVFFVSRLAGRQAGRLTTSFWMQNISLLTVRLTDTNARNQFYFYRLSVDDQSKYG